ncbi:MAG TPA: Na+/H+ antiporter NhaA [Phnomibacter sp.]|nr:Na+/H+ antiporter NhaA [Phnomibacter sp.]
MPIGFLRRRFINYLQEFIHDSRAIGIILLSCTVVSLLVANTEFGPVINEWLVAAWHPLESMHLPHSILHLINDGLMAIFFFLVGMEIKRELVVGELSSVKRALLPIAAAAGGMVMPAIIFLLFNKGTFFQNGWGIPTATDIAFSLGVASMLGKRFPNSLKIFLTALAIIDDLGAILVIAFFYGDAVKLVWLLAAGGIVLVLYWLNKKRYRFGLIQLFLGFLLWYAVFNSGIHATIAGVVFAFMVPAHELTNWEHKLHNPVNFLILPLFALANTVIVLNASVLGEVWTSTLGLGVMAGLVLGKPLGIFFACRTLVRNKVADLPKGINWYQLFGAGIVAGIGFTMSIFITGLAYSDLQYQDISKIAILFAALISIVAGVVWFRAIKNPASIDHNLR